MNRGVPQKHESFARLPRRECASCLWDHHQDVWSRTSFARIAVNSSRCEGCHWRHRARGRVSAADLPVWGRSMIANTAHHA